MPVPFLDLPAQYHALKDEIDPAMKKVLETSAFILGPAVEQFEKDFAAFCGVAHCIGVNSGTSALSLLLRAHGIGTGDEVITVANTFFATLEAIVHVGATPVLVDCEESTALMNPDLLERAITKKTKAILPVHIYGQTADMTVINVIAKKYGILVFEDACQAHGAREQDRMTGGLSDAAAFSFYPGKNLGAYGEAGAITTNDTAIAKKIRMLRDHGSTAKYHHDSIGWNERMDGIQGAVLSVKLRYLQKWNEAR
ncbi:DegT/DnrJ/EryC1/StrS family aminotransferase, partial [Candidatus Uhrbacteria bacterium]|nr:DegT/DnrJ/EryC1/StrS family aminotransferase [Candidatus Uhrbacteria bacterium]